MRRPKTGLEWWHVYSRGARRLSLFHDDEDRRIFIRILEGALAASGCLLAGYVLMSNHYHLILKGTSEQITDCLHRINYPFSLYHNGKYGLSGHAFDGPYRAHLQPSPMLLPRTAAYVFLNPVAAGIVRHPGDYRWSGYLSFMGLQGSPLPVYPDDILRPLGGDPERARERFLAIVEREGKRPPKSPSPFPTASELFRLEFEWLLEYARENASRLNGEDPVEVAACWGRRCGIPPKAMAPVLGFPDTSPVYALLQRCHKRAPSDPAFASLLILP